MMPTRFVMTFALRALACAGTAVTGLAASPDLIVVAEPSASSALDREDTSGALTLSYRVVEIFDGEPGGASVIVRHDALSSDERTLLRERERVILLARRDPAAEGRFVAPAPLRATPSAVAAFRRWSAPEDVRQARPLGEVLAEVGAARAGHPPALEPPRDAIPGPARPEPAAARLPASAPVDRAELVPVAEPEARPVAGAAADVPVAELEAKPGAVAVARVPVARAPVAEPDAPMPWVPADGVDRSAAAMSEIDEESLAPRREVIARAAPAPMPPPAPRSREDMLPERRPAPSVAASRTDWDPPLFIDPDLKPEDGPGLPPAPAAEALGPPVPQRSDLRPPPERRRRR